MEARGDHRIYPKRQKPGRGVASGNEETTESRQKLLAWAKDLNAEDAARKAGKPALSGTVPDISQVRGFPDDEFVVKMWYRLLVDHGIFVHPDQIKSVPHAYWKFLEDVHTAKEYYKQQNTAKGLFG